MSSFRIKPWKTLVPLLLAFASVQLALPQSEKKPHPNSPVFKGYQPPITAPMLEQSDATYQMWQGFRVMQKANAGDPVSQFELSVRYLTGRGFKADTIKAAYWTRQASNQNHLLARYNLAIFEFNGWGVEWNPFEAYRNFKSVAERNTPEAQYVLAQFLTEDLVLPRNMDEAYRWMKLAADSGYAPAQEAVKEFEKRGYRPPRDSSKQSGASQNSGPQSSSSGAIQFQFLNFSPDTLKAPSDTVLFEDAVRAAMLSKDQAIQKIFGSMSKPSGGFELDSAAFQHLVRSSEAGSPEALTLVGWCYERGVRVDKDVIQAAVRYVRGIRLDSPRASRLLYDLIQRKEFFESLKQRVNTSDPDAMYVWACLVALGFDRQLTDTQAIQMLERAVGRNHLPAMIELGLCYYAGRWTKRDEQRAKEMWERAATAGSNEAAVRLAITTIRETNGEYLSAIPVLQSAADNGSVLAEVALAYCFENGIGLARNYAEAARLYRSSVQRGSQDAFRALQRMHDRIRSG